MSANKQCEEHSLMMADIARGEEARRHLEKRDNELLGAVQDLTKKFGEVEKKIARYGGGLAVLASIPIFIKIADWLIPIAAAAIR